VLPLAGFPADRGRVDVRAAPVVTALVQDRPAQRLPARVMRRADRGEVVQFVAATLATRNDVMDVETLAALAAEQAANGAAMTVAIEDRGAGVRGEPMSEHVAPLAIVPERADVVLGEPTNKRGGPLAGPPPVRLAAAAPELARRPWPDDPAVSGRRALGWVERLHRRFLSVKWWRLRAARDATAYP